MVRTINNFPITIEDVCNANTIYGCNVTTLKGKKVLQQPNSFQAEYIEVPDNLKKMVGNLTVAYNVMFVKRNPVVVSISRGVNFTTMEYVSQRIKTVLAYFIGMTFQFY